MARPQESAHNERKLKPIYDYLDNGYYKKSMQEIDKLLKKNKDWPYLRVLKALALIRMNRHKEGNDILKEVCNDIPFDESTLQTMTICYRDLHQPDKIPTIYENALKKDSASEKLFTNLFMAYVRIQDYKKQQLTALNLYKVHPKNPYYFWAVMSIYMQAITASDEAMATKITLPLAAKMCEKFYNDNKFESDQEIELYLMILERQQKHAAMIELIDKAIGSGRYKDALGFVKHRKVQLLKRENRLKEAFDVLADLIRHNSDQCEYYSELFQLAALLDESKADGDGDFENTKQFLALLNEMCDRKRILNWQSNLEAENDENATEPKGKSRGPAIAKIVIFHLIQQNAKEKEKSQSGSLDYSKVVDQVEGLQREEYVVDLIYEYFLQFGSKFVCVKDIIFMLQQTGLSQEQIQSLLVKMKLSLLNLGSESSLVEINKSLCYHYLEYYNSDLTAGESPSKPSELDALFQLHSIALGLAAGDAKKNSDSNEVKSDKVAKSGKPSHCSQPFDAVVYLLTNKISAGLDIYNTESCLLPSSAILLDLVVLLESALNRNSYDFYSKLLLVRLYNAFGAASSSHALMETLDVKLIQNDTMGHFFLSAFLSAGLFSHAQQFLNASWKFYSYNFKEASDFIINLYKYGSFTKIEEIMSFNYKLRNSLQHHHTFIERLYMNLLLECKNHTSFIALANDCVSHVVSGSFKVEWDKICDNRDLTLLSSNHHQLHSHILNTLKEKTSTDEILWLRYRFALMHSVTLASCQLTRLFDEVDKTATTDNEDSQKANDDRLSLDSFAQMVQQLVELCNVAKSITGASNFKYCLEGPAPSRINGYFKNVHYSQCITSLLSYLLGIFKYCSRSDSEILTLSFDMSAAFTEFTTKLDALQRSQLSIFNIREALEEVTNWVETFGICISLLDIAFNTIQQFSKISKKSKKKKSANSSPLFKDSEQVIAVISERLSLFRTALEEALKQLQTFTEKAPHNLALPTFELRFASRLENASALESLVKEKLKLSYEKSFSELFAVVQTKLKYANSLGAFTTTTTT